MIPSIIDNLDPKSKLVAMNAVSFRATWTEKFDKNNTKEDQFNVTTGNSVTIPMMSRNAEVLYSKNDLYSTIRLPFGSGDIYSMYVLLPAEGKTTNDVINNLNNAEWKSQNMQNTLVDIKLPRFTVVNDIILNDIIAQMGIEYIFSPSKADFSLIGKDIENLYVSLLKQKTAIEVVEDGTKGSSTTVAMVDGMSTPGMNKATFHCNRPFIYIIQEENSNIIFFIGTFRGE
jgi:serpin B